ncbi:glycine/sarcosine/betaine reductase component B subunit [Natranaerobius trueperi]|uniref:Beta-aspartyl-peptidase n=1 Tax=Natranaerobius trueperi TaxID=759412 RepID=A0A226C0L9_9FIRM|nr:glycine/sarcosine/betaine reductase component B subunit [Natranaerobius trueperi]OWZ84721.1 beta-aspartyl-peptidase [Natranaerobius trueperi]
MKLELSRIKIQDVCFGEKTDVLDGGILQVNKEELKQILMDFDQRIKELDIHLAKPGESVRIIPVKDVIEPRVKVEGNGDIFPGFMGKVDKVGSGKTLVLDGACVVTTGDIVGFQEGIIDMKGTGADYTPFSKKYNVVVDATPIDDLPQHQHEEMLRLIGLKAATYLAEATAEKEANENNTFETKPLFKQAETYPELPKVGYVYMLQSQGLLHDTYVYGVDIKNSLPTLLYPTEVMDGAIISGNCVSACDKNTTYHHLNNPIIEDLYERHGKDINFMGVIITNENVTLADKQRSSDYVASLAENLGLDGVVISEEGFGNPDTDLIMNCKKIEEKGIKTVLVTDEYAGRDGSSQSLADADPKADAVVTGGNANETVVLPQLDKVIGNVEKVDLIAGGFEGSLKKDQGIEVELQAIIGATNELGFNKMGAIES